MDYKEYRAIIPESGETETNPVTFPLRQYLQTPSSRESVDLAENCFTLLSNQRLQLSQTRIPPTFPLENIVYSQDDTYFSNSNLINPKSSFNPAPQTAPTVNRPISLATGIESYDIWVNKPALTQEQLKITSHPSNSFYQNQNCLEEYLKFHTPPNSFQSINYSNLGPIRAENIIRPEVSTESVYFNKFQYYHPYRRDKNQPKSIPSTYTPWTCGNQAVGIFSKNRQTPCSESYQIQSHGCAPIYLNLRATEPGQVIGYIPGIQESVASAQHIKQYPHPDFTEKCDDVCSATGKEYLNSSTCNLYCSSGSASETESEIWSTCSSPAPTVIDVTANRLDNCHYNSSTPTGFEEESLSDDTYILENQEQIFLLEEDNSDNIEDNTMYPVTMDQSRQDNAPGQHTLQVHMHHLCCPCSSFVYPYYPPGYRHPLMTQPPPVPRPSYLHHYQYTQLHVNPAYNAALPPPIAPHLPQAVPQSPPSTVDLAFGPPPRDRRNFDSQDYDEQRQISDKNRSEGRNSSLQYPFPLGNSYSSENFSDNLQDNFRNLTATQVASFSTENYIKYLDTGCLIGETIAKRNEQRPCFKNIQNLCNRTRSEVMKPNITVSNIHSQGVPWATKDFIFAFVRAINCWCILRGYLGSKDGNLGKIDREISSDFRACYAKWERCTKQLTHYLIQTFSKLDEANSSPNLNTSNHQSHSNPGPSTPVATATPVVRGRNASPPQETPRKTVSVMTDPVTQSTGKNFSNKEMAALKGIPGILHIPPTTSNEVVEVRNLNSESTGISPRDEDSSSESPIYMKPGSYSVPTKQPSSQSNTNSPKSLEFFDCGQNVGQHARAITENADPFPSDLLCDKVWQTAQNVTPEFIKQNAESPPSACIANNIDNFCDVTSQHNKQIENWLNDETNIFDYADEDQTQDLLRPSVSAKCSKSADSLIPRYNLLAINDLDGASRAYRNRPMPRNYSTYRRNFGNPWENQTGGLTDRALSIFDSILKELERTDFSILVNRKIPFEQIQESDLRNPTDLSIISKKLKNKKHVSVNEVVHDFRHIICCCSEYFKDAQTIKQLTFFRETFDGMINRAFSIADFTHITGEPNEPLGPLVLKQRPRPLKKTSEGDGDH